MNIFVSILGLGFLILIHEAGHFFVARAVGMNPRKFYLGFPPAIVKTKRTGSSTASARSHSAATSRSPACTAPPRATWTCTSAAPSRSSRRSRRPVDALRARLDESDYTGALEAVTGLAQALAEAKLSPAAAKAAERGLGDVEDALAPDAYWRAKTWKRVAVIFAGPGANLLFAIAIFAALFMALSPATASASSRGRRTTTRSPRRSTESSPTRRPRRWAFGRATTSSRSTA